MSAWPAQIRRHPIKGIAQISLLSLGSLRALSQRLGRALDPRRFRGSLWLDGLAPWEAFDLLGRTIEPGPVGITDRIERCRATEANPETGQRDANLLRVLEDDHGHQDFGLHGTVRIAGTLRTGDGARL